MTALPPSPFLTDSAAPIPSAADTAVALISPPCPDAAAGPFADPPQRREAQEAPAAADPNTAAAGLLDNFGSDISNVGEIFLFAKILCAQARVSPGLISPEAVRVAQEITDYEETYYDPPPLFLRRSA